MSGPAGTHRHGTHDHGAHDHGADSRLARMETGHFWFAGRDVLVRELLERHLDGADPGRVVDLGSGTGRFARSLAEEGLDVLALDHAPGADGPAQRTLVADACHLPLATGSVGTVLARDVLEHVDDDAALAECYRVLRPGGLLLVLVPAWPSLWSDRDVRAGHLRRYRTATLRDAVERAGFTVEEIRGYQFLLLPAIVLTRLLSRARGPQVIDREEAPAPRLNRVLSGVNRWEGALARRAWTRPPTGSTLALVARRGDDRAV